MPSTNHCRAALSMVALVALALVAGCAQPLVSGRIVDRTPPPNWVVIVIDDAGYADFGFNGNSEIGTPSIDQLAADGVVFDRAYVTASVCSPSRAGLITGRYQQRFGHEFNLPYRANEPFGLPLTEQTIADRMGARGYTCGAIGKWHLGVHDPYHPHERGFDEFSGFLGGSRTYFEFVGDAAPRVWERDRERIPEDELGYLTDRIALDSIDFIERHTLDPFFLYVNFSAVHTPMHALEADLVDVGDYGKPRRRKLIAMTRALDRAIGQIRAALCEAGIDDRTAIWIVNDNGGATTNASDNGELRGMKGSKWEGGVRVPSLLLWPGVTKVGTRYPQPISTLDIGATMIESTAVPAPKDAGLDGVDLRPYLTRPERGRPHEQLFWRRGPAAAVLEGEWKLIRVESNPTLLFDLSTDPSESHNIADAHPAIVARLEASLATWEQGLAEPLWDTGQPWRDNQIRKHRMEIIGREAERSLP